MPFFRSVVVLALLVSSCSDRVVDADPDDLEQPQDSDQLYAECAHPDDCAANLDTCVFPAGESGFCSIECGAADECGDTPGGTAEVVCISVGTGTPRSVCALDCGNNRSCPTGMGCRLVETNEGERAICF